MLLRTFVLLVATTTVARGLASLGNGSVKKLKKPAGARMSVKAKVAELCRNSPELCKFKAEPKRKEDENVKYMQQERQIKQRQFNNVPYMLRSGKDRVNENDSKRRTPAEMRRPKLNLERKREKSEALDKAMTCDLSAEANTFISDVFARITEGQVEKQDLKKMFLTFLLEPSPFFTCTSIVKNDVRAAAVSNDGNYDSSSHGNRNNNAFDYSNNRRTQQMPMALGIQWGQTNDVHPEPQYHHGTKPRGDSGARESLASISAGERRKLRDDDALETKPGKGIYGNSRKYGADLVLKGRRNGIAVSKDDTRRDTGALDQLELEMQQKQILNSLMDVLQNQRGK